MMQLSKDWPKDEIRAFARATVVQTASLTHVARFARRFVASARLQSFFLPPNLFHDTLRESDNLVLKRLQIRDLQVDLRN